jgi:hypothetical protein
VGATIVPRSEVGARWLPPRPWSEVTSPIFTVNLSKSYQAFSDGLAASDCMLQNLELRLSENEGGKIQEIEISPRTQFDSIDHKVEIDLRIYFFQTKL